MKYILLMAITFAVLACSGTKDAVIEEVQEIEEVVDNSETPKEKEPTRAGLNDAESEDCYNDRKSLNALSNVEGEVSLVAGVYMIQTYEGNKRYQPCKLPKNMEKEGTAVIFSGIIKEIFPSERRAGTPFVLTHIDVTM